MCIIQREVNIGAIARTVSVPRRPRKRYTVASLLFHASSPSRAASARPIHSSARAVVTLSLSGPTPTSALDDVCGGLARCRDFRDLQFSAYVLEQGVLECLDVAGAQREVGHDYARDEPPDRIVSLEDVAISAGADRGGDQAERLGHQLSVGG